MANSTKLLISLGMLGLSSIATAVPTDLSTWTWEGSNTWTVAADTHSVFQSINSDPTVFYSDFNGQGRQLSGTITVEETGGDDDFIGFVLGFQPGDVSAGTTDFILIDWKQADQSISGCVSQAGLAISHVTGGLSPNGDAWCHRDGITELARAANLGSTGWIDNQTYSFDLIFNPTNIQVRVDGVLELDINGSFADGRFGFYNFSQPRVRYSAIEDNPAPPPSVPVAPSLALMGLGISLLFGMRKQGMAGR